MQKKLDELAEKAKKLAAESTGEMKGKLSELASSEEWDQLKTVAAGMGEEAAVFVRKYPLQSVLGAAALGFLLGSSLGRKR